MIYLQMCINCELWYIYWYTRIKKKKKKQQSSHIWICWPGKFPLFQCPPLWHQPLILTLNREDLLNGMNGMKNRNKILDKLSFGRSRMAWMKNRNLDLDFAFKWEDKNKVLGVKPFGGLGLKVYGVRCWLSNCFQVFSL